MQVASMNNFLQTELSRLDFFQQEIHEKYIHTDRQFIVSSHLLLTESWVLLMEASMKGSSPLLSTYFEKLNLDLHEKILQTALQSLMGE